MNKSDRRNIKAHNVAIAIITISCIATIVESMVRGWENWVAPIIVAGIVASWAFHISQYKESAFRENFYMVFSMVVAFYHGVHASSYYDIIVMSVLLMVTATLLQRKEYLLMLLIEYFMLMGMQTAWFFINHWVTFDSLVVSRLVLQFLAEICIYNALMALLKDYSRVGDELERKENEEEMIEAGMEDFLANVSHELRTPVNVINGMSTLMLKKDMREDAVSIRDAGRRLSYQIEDIQDFSELQRNGAILEPERYMITSLMNDIVVNYTTMSNRKNLEFIIDLDPNIPVMLKGDSHKINKIILHILDNAFKFTRTGGVYLKITGRRQDYGLNLGIEVTDTGPGMSMREIERISKGTYRTNRKREKSTGGIGLGLPIVYGFVRLMNGFVSIDSQNGRGTTVRVSLVQEIVDPAPCLSADSGKEINIAFHVTPERFKIAKIREFYTAMASNIASGLGINLYNVPSLNELKKLMDKRKITHVFMGSEEYGTDPGYFDEIAKGDTIVVISAFEDFKVNKGSKVIVMPKPLYGYPVVKFLNGEIKDISMLSAEEDVRPDFAGVRALIVDDEPMNLVVATGLFKDYDMIIDTAESGREALVKFDKNDYDVVFMDHMMPEMDGIEAMKRIRNAAEQSRRPVKIIALTANAISGARAMFLREGFDGFISKPINITDFERVLKRVLTDGSKGHNGGAR